MHKKTIAANQKVSVRDEANALTYVSFRCGMLEELHAGKHSPMLDNKGLSRITNDEMKALMVEASRKLAAMLEMKKRQPKSYRLAVKTICEHFCIDWEK